jgi:hypothetical protein
MSQFSAILPIFGEKIGVFLKNQYKYIFSTHVEVICAQIANFLGENIFVQTTKHRI